MRKANANELFCLSLHFIVSSTGSLLTDYNCTSFRIVSSALFAMCVREGSLHNAKTVLIPERGEGGRGGLDSGNIS